MELSVFLLFLYMFCLFAIVHLKYPYELPVSLVLRSYEFVS